MGAWYKDKRSVSHIESYKNEKAASRAASEAAKYGWVAQGVAATDGHVNVGRTAGRVLLFGLPFLLFGASRSKGKVTLTYTRPHSAPAPGPYPPPYLQQQPQPQYRRK